MTHQQPVALAVQPSFFDERVQWIWSAAETVLLPALRHSLRLPDAVAAVGALSSVPIKV